MKESGRIALHNAVPPSSEKRRLLGKFDLFILNLQLFRNFGGNFQMGGGEIFRHFGYERTPKKHRNKSLVTRGNRKIFEIIPEPVCS